MSLTSSSDLKDAVANWLDRSDLTTRIPEFIQLAEATFNKVLRDTKMVVSTTITVSSGSITSSSFPTTLLDIASVRLQGSNTAFLQHVSNQELEFMHKHRFTSNGTPCYYSVIGRTMRVGPAPTVGTTLVVDNYRSLPSLVTTTSNWLMQNDPDLYLYGTLMHAAPYLSDEQNRAINENVMVKSLTIALARHDKLTMEQTRNTLIASGGNAPAG